MHFYFCHPLNFLSFVSGCLSTSFPPAHVSHPQQKSQNTLNIIESQFQVNKEIKACMQVDSVEWTQFFICCHFNAKKKLCIAAEAKIATGSALAYFHSRKTDFLNCNCGYHLADFQESSTFLTVIKKLRRNLLYDMLYISSVTSHHLLRRWSHQNSKKLFRADWTRPSDWPNFLGSLSLTSQSTIRSL